MPVSTAATNAWEFDPTGLARALSNGRAAAGLSTRELSRRAGISQSYVVALERSRDSAAERTPTPTVDVVARLAEAMGVEPHALYASSLRRTGQHVLLVVDGRASSPLRLAQRATGDHSVQWLIAASTNHLAHHPATPRVDLRRDGRSTYDPAAITAALRDELQAIRPDVEGRQLGLVFAETSAVMSTLDDPDTVIQFEHIWDQVVRSAAAEAGAHAAWNVCVYELEALRRLADPVDATLDLMRSHHTVYNTRRSRITSGFQAALQILEHLRPDTESRSDWRTRAEEWITDLGLVA